MKYLKSLLKKNIFSTINFRIFIYLFLYNNFTLLYIYNLLNFIYQILRVYNFKRFQKKMIRHYFFKKIYSFH